MDVQNSQKTVNKMAAVSPYLAVITLNVKGLSFPIRRYNGRMEKKTRPNNMLPIITSFSLKGTHRLGVTLQANGNPREAR